MAGPVACSASRLTPYSATGPACHRRRPAALAGVLVLSLAIGGCGLSGQLGGLFGSGSVDSSAYARTETTGSIRSAADKAASTQASAGLPPETDLAFARTAIAEVLTRGGQDVSAPWENPGTGARGTVTPIAMPYTQEGMTCRDFLASHVSGAGTPAWMQGEACRNGAGRWEVRTLRPWSRS